MPLPRHAIAEAAKAEQNRCADVLRAQYALSKPEDVPLAPNLLPSSVYRADTKLQRSVNLGNRGFAWGTRLQAPSSSPSLSSSSSTTPSASQGPTDGRSAGSFTPVLSLSTLNEVASGVAASNPQTLVPNGMAGATMASQRAQPPQQIQSHRLQQQSQPQKPQHRAMYAQGPAGGQPAPGSIPGFAGSSSATSGAGGGTRGGDNFTSNSLNELGLSSNDATLLTQLFEQIVTDNGNPGTSQNNGANTSNTTNANMNVNVGGGSPNYRYQQQHRPMQQQNYGNQTYQYQQQQLQSYVGGGGYEAQQQQGKRQPYRIQNMNARGENDNRGDGGYRRRNRRSRYQRDSSPSPSSSSSSSWYYGSRRR